MHSNSGACLGCAKIFNKYPGFHEPLKDWFFEVQSKIPTFHISCAGRGQIDQDAAFSRRASNAHWLESAHNFNAAFDTFFMIDGKYCVDENFYEEIKPLLTVLINWYGWPEAKFRETPHFEWTTWRDLVKDGRLTAVE